MRWIISDPARAGSLLVTPTATMAEHIRHQLARQLSPLRPSRVITLAKFLNHTGVPAAASGPYTRTWRSKKRSINCGPRAFKPWRSIVDFETHSRR